MFCRVCCPGGWDNTTWLKCIAGGGDWKRGMVWVALVERVHVGWWGRMQSWSGEMRMAGRCKVGGKEGEHSFT